MKNDKNGFTLIEVLVVGILLAILALGAFSMFSMYTENSRVTAAHLRMQRQSEAVLDEVGRRVREANQILVFSGGAAEVLTPGVTPPDVDDATGFILMNTYDNVQIGGFLFENGTIKHWVDDVWVTFRIDNNDIELSGNNNFFRMDGNRKQLSFTMTLQAPTLRDEYVHLEVEGGIYQCRL